MEEVSIREFNSHKIATAFHNAGGKDVVVFCHGYRGTSVGPNRFFVLAARKLAAQGISSLRFDQYGSGNSEGDFMQSSFDDWVATTKAIARGYIEKGFRVALLGQSMGAATVLTVASELPGLSAVVAWSPDPNVDPFEEPAEGFCEEGGQRVQAAFWREAHDAHVASRLHNVAVPAYIVQCTDDEYVDKQNRDAIAANAQEYHTVETFEGYKHSAWTYVQAEDIIAKSTGFIVRHLPAGVR